MREFALTDVERLGAFSEADRTFLMTEETFRAFYDQTARPVWAYLARITGDARVADDLLQEAYYRLLRSRAAFESDEHRRNYLFRIATNLARDHRRRPANRERHLDEHSEANSVRFEGDDGDRAVRRIDLQRAMERLKPRERAMLWLAYAQGLSHDEIATVLSLKRASLKALLFRARRRVLALMRAAAPGDRR